MDCVLCLSGHYSQLLQLRDLAAVVFYAVTAIGCSGCGSGAPTFPAGARARIPVAARALRRSHRP